MISVLTRTKSHNHMTVTAAEYELEKIEKSVQNFQVPKFAWRELYHLSTLQLRQKYYLKCVEESISLSNGDHMVSIVHKKGHRYGKKKGIYIHSYGSHPSSH